MAFDTHAAVKTLTDARRRRGARGGGSRGRARDDPATGKLRFIEVKGRRSDADNGHRHEERDPARCPGPTSTRRTAIRERIQPALAPRLILDVRARCDPRGLGPVAVIRCRHGLRHACGRENVDRRRSRRGTRGGGGSRSRARRVRRPPASWSRGAHFDTALAQLESRLAWRLVYGRHSGSASRVRCRYSNPCWQRFASRKRWRATARRSRRRPTRRSAGPA